MKRCFYNWMLLTFSLAISLVIGEVLCAIFVPAPFVKTDIFGRKIMNRPRPSYSLIQHGNRTYWDFVPNQKGRTKFLDDYDCHWEINSLGLRSPELAANREEIFRILALGDSQTFGGGVDQDRTFCAQLETLLQTKKKKRVEVLNAGVNGYGTFEALWKLERVIGQVQPDIVVVVIFVDNVLVADEGNDLWNNYVRIEEETRILEETPESTPTDKTTESLPAKPKISFLADHSHLYGFFSTLKRKVKGKKTYLDRVKEYRALDRERVELKMVWQRTRELIFEIEKLSRQAVGAQTILVYLPGLASIELNDRSALQELEKTSLPLVSMFEVLDRGRKGNSMNIRFKHDGHYNEFAHSLIAKELASFIVNNGFLQESTKSIPSL